MNKYCLNQKKSLSAEGVATGVIVFHKHILLKVSI